MLHFLVKMFVSVCLHDANTLYAPTAQIVDCLLIRILFIMEFYSSIIYNIMCTNKIKQYELHLLHFQIIESIHQRFCTRLCYKGHVDMWCFMWYCINYNKSNSTSGAVKVETNLQEQ